MGLRLWNKSIKLAMRSQRRFIAFTLMYTVLMVWMTYNFQLFLYESSEDVLLLLVSIVSTLILSILYAWIVINYRKNEIATLKCIGYKNSNIRTIIIGELTWVTFVAFMIMAETLIHITAGATYFYQQMSITPPEYLEKTTPILNIWPVLATLAMFLTSQILGIIVMYSKILKLRPIVALRVLK